MTAGRWSSWSIQIPQLLMLWWPAMKAGSTAMTQRLKDRVPSGSMLALPDPRRPDRANPHKNFWWSLFWLHWHDLHALGSHWTHNQQGILCRGFKGVQEEIPREEASTLQIGSVAFPPGQCTSLQLHPCQRLFDQEWVSRQFLSLPIVQILLPVTFGYSLSSKAVIMRQWGDERGCDEGHWHAHTRGLPWGLPDVVVTIQQVHCSRRRLLRRGLEFHVCTISISTHTKKGLEIYLMSPVDMNSFR